MAVDNIQYKDRLFNFLFGTEENKAWTLSLYNAVNGSHYTDPDEIEITTIKEVMYLGMHNDVSFLISNEMDLYEQQSTYNPNMPVRLLQYVGNLYEKYINQTGMNDFVIKPFLVAHRAEVKGMLLTEYNEAEAMEKFEQDGDRKRAIKDIQSLMETLKLTAKQAMDALKIPVSEQSKYMNML